MNYVLGFAFDPFGRVALIRKRDVDGVPLRNRLNGIGGKIETNETSVQAMRREFREETGVDVEEAKWQYLGLMQGKNWNVAMFRVRDPAIQHCQTMTDERVELFALHELVHERCGDNVRPLIMLADLPDDNRPVVNLTYME
jgi:8-oxo-dGTP pyrophosphatase MutT (NUDIX family)